jgi:hypothetical protein
MGKPHVQVEEIASWSGEIPDWAIAAVLLGAILAIVALLWFVNRRPR